MPSRSLSSAKIAQGESNEKKKSIFLFSLLSRPSLDDKYKLQFVIDPWHQVYFSTVTNCVGVIELSFHDTLQAQKMLHAKRNKFIFFLYHKNTLPLQS